MSLPSGPILPSADILNEFAEGKFVLSNLAAKRAKQLKDGAHPLVRIESNHPLTVALAEIAAGKIKPILGREGQDPAAAEGAELVYGEEIIGTERGILLPALDEVEVDLVTSLSVDEPEHEHEEDAAAAPSLADLLDDTEGVAETEQVDSEEGTLSLSDIAEQESQEEEEEPSE